MQAAVAGPRGKRVQEARLQKKPRGRGVFRREEQYLTDIGESGGETPCRETGGEW